MNDFQFDYLDGNIPPNYDWSAGYLPSLAKSLVELKDKFYKDREERIMSNLAEPLIFFDINKHRPEKCLGDDQIFLVYEHLYYHYLNDIHTRGLEYVLPPSLFTVIEGTPGTWKYFVLKTIRNITCQLTNGNNADMASAPTGCAAALIDGTNHCRCNSIPVRKSFQKCPFNLKVGDTTKHRSLRMKTALVNTRVMDEHSLAGRAYWAWLQHRSE